MQAENCDLMTKYLFHGIIVYFLPVIIDTVIIKRLTGDVVRNVESAHLLDLTFKISKQPLVEFAGLLIVILFLLD